MSIKIERNIIENTMLNHKIEVKNKWKANSSKNFSRNFNIIRNINNRKMKTNFSEIL